MFLGAVTHKSNESVLRVTGWHVRLLQRATAGCCCYRAPSSATQGELWPHAAHRRHSQHALPRLPAAGCPREGWAAHPGGGRAVGLPRSRAPPFQGLRGHRGFREMTGTCRCEGRVPGAEWALGHSQDTFQTKPGWLRPLSPPWQAGQLPSERLPWRAA